MGHHNAFYIQSNLVYGGNIGFMKMGPKYYGMKIAFKDLYYLTGGAPPAWGMDLANIMDKY